MSEKRRFGARNKGQKKGTLTRGTMVRKKAHWREEQRQKKGALARGTKVRKKAHWCGAQGSVCQGLCKTSNTKKCMPSSV